MSTSTTYYFTIKNEDSSGNIGQTTIRVCKTAGGGSGGGSGGGGGGGGNPPDKAAVIANLKAEIARITAEIQKLLAELAKIKAEEKAREVKIPYGFRFRKNLYFGMRNNNVVYLQVFLRNQGTAIYPEGKVTGYFGILTRKAVIRFQNKYSQDILLPWGLTRGTGTVGRTTRIKMNEILAKLGY